MISKLGIFAFLVVLFCVSVQINAYIEQRTFRERTNIFCRLNKQCKQYEEWDAEYKKLINISDVLGLAPEGYLVRFPFYILAERDAHIVFTETENPDWFTDNVYEIVFGGWENKRTTLNRKRQDDELTFVYADEVLSKTCPLKALIEITTAGDIRIYIEHQIKPVITFKDTTPLKIKFFGFSSLGESLARFFYDCRGDDVYSTSQLQTSCMSLETRKSEHDQFIRINDNYVTLPDDQLIDFPLYIQAPRDVHVLLASNNESNRIETGYEIVIGDHFNRRVLIQKIQNNTVSVLNDVRRGDILHPNETLTALLKISSHGKIDVYTKVDHTQFKLLTSAQDKNFSPTNLNYMSLASYNNTNVKYFYDCSLPLPHINLGLAKKYAPPGHPLLLEDPDFTDPLDKRNWLTSRCKYYTNPKYEYRDFLSLNEIHDSQPAGYQARLSFYAQGTRNAHILLSRTSNPNVLVDNVYEIILGGWVNTRVLIRRKKSDQVLQQVFINNVLTAQTPTKFVIEVANSGTISVYSESDKLNPIATVFDPVVLPVKYVSFCAYDNLVRFYYDCKGANA